MAADKQPNQAGPGAAEEKNKRPAQVPGDAESPPKGERSPATEKAPNHTDPTEPVRSGQDKPR